MLKIFAAISFLILIFSEIKFIEANINVKLGCGKSSASKYLTLETPSSNVPNICRYTIRAKSSYVCQLRVDFDINLIEPTKPTATNNIRYPQCVDDVLDIGGFRLCGTELQQHIYIPFNSTANDKTKDITITTAARAGGVAPPTWNLKVTQLECSLGSPLRSIANGIGSLIDRIIPDSLRPRTFAEGILARTFFYDGFFIAPNGCTQYYPQSTGSISSFNYKNGMGVYPGNMKYAICFRRTRTTQQLQLTAETFNIGYEPQGTGLQINDFCYPQIPTPDRSEDFLMIPQSTKRTDTVRAFYYCGNSLNNDQVTTNMAGPLSIVFNADNIYNEAAPETGFKFSYIVS